MTAEAATLETLLAAPPPGFDVVSTSPIEIAHKSAGMRRMNNFLFGWVAVWTVICCLVTWEYLAGGKEKTIHLPAFVWGFDVLVALLAVYVIFARRSYRLMGASLVFELRSLGFSFKRSVACDQIEVVRQVKDGGQGGDTFPSHGLRLEGKKGLTLLYRQPHASSLWLGQVVSAWADKRFIQESENPPRASL